MSIDLRSLTQKELKEFLVAKGEKAFRAKQVYQWIHKGISSIDDMNNISKDLREKLKGEAVLKNVEVLEVLTSKDKTKKYLLKYTDGQIVEAVYMEYKHGVSVCLSTQVGCKMGCTFCASTIGGIVRNLTAGEILGALYAIEEDADVKVSNIVLMGSGEPLDNYDEVMKFISLVTDPNGRNLANRNLTLSTCGLVPEIKKLADLDLQLTLAISLHQPFDDNRSAIMPINRKYDIASLLSAVDYYIKKTHRRVTFEYALIEGQNDRDEDAKRLIKLLKGKLVHINLIPVNPVVERDFHASDEKRIERFKNMLTKGGITTTVRRELGSDINAACGQLRKGYIENNE